MFKICSRCKLSLEYDKFNKSKNKKDGLANYCRECSKIRLKEHYIKNKAKYILKANIRSNKIRLENRIKINNIKLKHGCSLCKENEPCCLDFHHLKDKKFEIGIATKSAYSWENIVKEINKCVLVCANCHRKIHDGLLKVNEVLKMDIK